MRSCVPSLVPYTVVGEVVGPLRGRAQQEVLKSRGVLPFEETLLTFMGFLVSLKEQVVLKESLIPAWLSGFLFQDVISSSHKDLIL